MRLANQNSSPPTEVQSPLNNDLHDESQPTTTTSAHLKHHSKKKHEQKTTLSRADALLLAQFSEKAQRYDDMAKYMKAVVNHGGELNTQEQWLLSNAFKQAVQTRKLSLKALFSKPDDTTKDAAATELLDEYKSKIKQELTEFCCDILELLESNLIPGVKTDKSKAFYFLLKGDFYRFLADFHFDSNGEQIIQEALDAYVFASNLAHKTLPCTDSVRLRIALNFSVFYHVILQDTQKAQRIARPAFDSAIDHLEELTTDNYEEVTALLHAIRDNLNVWDSQLAKS